MAHPERNVFTEANYELIISYTRNKTFKFKTREGIAEELKYIVVIRSTDSASVLTALLSRLVEHGVMRIEYPTYTGDSSKYKFTGNEAKWHLNCSNKKESFLSYGSGPAAELANSITKAWYA